MAAMLALVALLLARPDPAEPALRTEAARLQAVVGELKIDETELTYIKAPLAKAEQAIDAGRPLLALLRLRDAGETAEAWAYANAREDVQKAGLPAFESEWQRLGGELRELRAGLPSDLGSGSPAALRALIEAALVTTDTLYVSGRLYGQNTTPQNGLLYLGMSRSTLPWARLLASLPYAAIQAPPLVSPDGALDALDGEILDAYAKATTADTRSAFISANTALKRARDLRRDARLFGTWFELLQSRRTLGLVRRMAGLTADPTSGDTQRLAELLRSRVAAWPAGIDNSLGRLFIEEAEAALDAGDLRRVAAIGEDVLPAYAAAVAGPAATLAQLQAPPPGAVTVTLVRWPYT